MDYELFFETMVENRVGQATKNSLVSLIETKTLDYETELCICEYDESGKKKIAIAVAHELMGIDVLRIGINDGTEIYYDSEYETIYTRQELFESWKQQLTNEDQTFIDFLVNAQDKSGTLEKIY